MHLGIKKNVLFDIHSICIIFAGEKLVMGKRVIFIALMFVSLATMAAGANKRFTLVIDAGHGGRDAGCVGAISKEKNLTLKMALAFGKFVERNCPDVKVIYTRKTDVFLELWQRAEIANKNKADLFLSIHINALPGKKISHGVQTYTLGRGRVSGSNKGISENLDVAKRENAVIVMEKDYKQHYAGFDPNSPESNIMFEFIQDTYRERSVELAKLMQRHVCAATGRQNGGAHQDNLAVLRLTSMPGCLLELGFISTPDEERFMNSADAPDKYARGIYNAFVAYKKKFFGGAAVPFEETTEQKVTIPSVVPEEYKEKAAEQKAETKPAKPQKMAELPKAQKQEEQPKETPVPATAQEETTTVKENPSQPESNNAKNTDGVPIFKVQIVASSKLLKAGSPQFKGLTDVDNYQEGGMYKYTVGASANYQEIYQLRKSVADKFPEAFVIAFKNGAKIDVREGIKEYRANRNK